MAFVEDEQANIIEKGRIVAEREIKLLRRRNDYVAFPDRVLVETGHADATVERRDRLAERAGRSFAAWFPRLRPRAHVAG